MVNSNNLPNNPFNSGKIVIVKIEHWWGSYIVQTANCFGDGDNYLAIRRSIDGGNYGAWKKIGLS